MRDRILCDAGWTTSLKRTSERGIESTWSDVSPSHRRRSRTFLGGLFCLCLCFLVVLGFCVGGLVLFLFLVSPRSRDHSSCMRSSMRS